MTWLALAALAAVVLAPLAWALLRPAQARGRGEADRALYAAQLAELDAQRAEGRLDEAAHAAARVEVQRRLLNAPAPEEAAPPRPSRLLLAGVLAVPLVAVPLYLWRGFPEMPSASFSERAEARARDEALIATLRARLARLDPGTEVGRQGWILLGSAERNRGRFEEAAEAWGRALDARFDPGLAGDLAEVEIERGGNDAAGALVARALLAAPGDPRLRFLAGLVEARAGRTENARSTWRALLAEAPADAPWREVVEGRLRALP